MADEQTPISSMEITLMDYTDIMYKENETASSTVEITEAQADAPLQELTIINKGTEDISEPIYIWLRATVEGTEIVNSDEVYEIPMSWKGWEMNEENTEGRKEIETSLTLAVDGEWSIAAREIINGELDPGTAQLDNLDADQDREYLEAWSQLIVPAVDSRISVVEIDENDEYVERTDIELKVKWLTDVPSSEGLAEAQKANYKYEITKNELDKAIDINREEGYIQVGVDTREHLRIENSGVTISQGEDMESQFTGRFIQFGNYRISNEFGGLLFYVAEE